jgi:hypothetical protein
MAKKGFSFEGFKKIGSDEKYTSFKHKDGHYIKVAHGGLMKNGDLLKQLQSLPLEPAEQDKMSIPFNQSPHKKSNEQRQSEAQAVAKYKQGRKMADGGDIDNGPPETQPTPILGGGYQGYDEGTPDGGVPESTPEDDQVGSPMTPEPDQGGAIAPTDPLGGAAGAADGSAAAGVDTGSQDPSQDPSATGPGTTAPIPGGDTPHPTGTLGDWMGQHAALAEQELAAGKIKPQTYKDLFNKKDTLGKIGSVFGMMLGGIGGALTHQKSAYMQNMDQEIQNDYDSQVKSSDNARSFYKMAQEDPMIQAQAAKYGADAKQVSQTVGNIWHRQAAFQSLADQVNKMSPNDPRYQAAQQSLLQVYQANKQDMTNLMAPYNAYNAIQGPEDQGSPGAPAQPQQQGAAPAQPQQQGAGATSGSPSATSILSPDAQNRFNASPYHPSMEVNPADGPALRAEFTQAQQADKMLGNLRGVFDDLKKNRDEVGKVGRGIEGLGGNIPVLGDIGRGAGRMIERATEKGTRFQSTQSRLTQDITNLLKGSNLSDDSARSFVAANTPENGEPDDVVDQKFKNIEAMVKQSTPTATLKKYKMLRK